jgi:hypothetical protein
MTMESIVVYAHLVATAIMVGVIWVVQLVVYPDFARVERARFSDYHRGYSHRMGLIVGPAMLIELASAILLLYLFRGAMNLFLVLNLLTLALIWLSTAFVQVPCHNQLGKAFEDRAHRKLVATNWIRTALWSARLLVLMNAVPQIA